MIRRDFSDLRRAVYDRWRRKLNTADIARDLNVAEREVERALHHITDVKFSVNTVLGAG